MEKQKEKAILERGIREYASVVAEFFGHAESLVDYSQSLYNFVVDEEHLKRQNVILPIVKKYIKKLFKIDAEIKLPLAINIVDHHSILNHPILLATNLAANAHRLLHGRNQESIIVFTSSIVPPNNFFNKKGFLLHDKKVALFSNKEMHQSSFFIEKHDFNFVERQKQINSWQNFTADEQNFLENIQAEILALDFSAAEDYNDQISITNNYLWKKMFAEEIRDSVPELFYVPQEYIFKELSGEIIFKNTIINKAIFDEDFRSLILKEFSGLIGCWDLINNKGSQFFWQQKSDLTVGRIEIKNNQLVGLEEDLFIPLQKEEVVNALISKKIIPGMFSIFGFLTFWCGIRPLVGHGSGNYLTEMKLAWLNVLKNYDPKESKRIEKINTKCLVGGQILSYKRDQSGQLQSQYAFDVIMEGGLKRDYLQRIIKMKYKDLLQPALIDIYQSYVPVDKREKITLEPKDLMGPEFDWI